MKNYMFHVNTNYLNLSDTERNKDHYTRIVYVREAYYGKVGQRRYDLRNKNCDTCKVKSCSTKQKKDKDIFFCIRIDL